MIAWWIGAAPGRNSTAFTSRDPPAGTGSTMLRKTS
jgi:hypothetical protein